MPTIIGVPTTSASSESRFVDDGEPASTERLPVCGFDLKESWTVEGFIPFYVSRFGPVAFAWSNNAPLSLCTFQGDAAVTNCIIELLGASRLLDERLFDKNCGFTRRVGP